MDINKKNYNFIKSIDYILKKNKFYFFISKNKFLIDKLMAMKTPYNILEMLKISYKQSENLISKYNISINNDDVYVIELFNDKTNKIWCANNNKFVNKNIDDFDNKFICIENINENCLKLLSIKSYLYNFLRVIKNNLLNIVKVYFLSIISAIFVFIISALFETIIDTIIPYKNINLLLEVILVILLISEIIFIINRFKKELISKYLRHENIKSIFIISEIMASLLLLIPIYIYNIKIFSLLFLSVSLLVLINYTINFLKNIISFKIKIRYKKILYGIFSIVFLLLLLYLNIVIYINNGINKGSILSNFIIYLYLLYSFYKTSSLFEEFDEDYKNISNIFFSKQLCKVHDQISDLKINNITIVEKKNNKLIKMENGTFHLFIGTEKSGKTYLSHCIRGDTYNIDFCIYYNDISIREFEKEFLKSKCKIIGNDYYRKGLKAYNYIFNNKKIDEKCRSYVLKKIGLDRILQIRKQNQDINDYELTDTERLLLIISKYILVNSKIIIFDGIFSRFDISTVNNIISLIKEMGMIGIAFERCVLNHGKFSQLYYLDVLNKEDTHV